MAGCHCDFSSKAPQAPSLMDIAVVDGILRQAANNMLTRHHSVVTGEMTPEDYDAKATHLASWWCSCLEGSHPTYVIDEEWHQYGLPDLLREKLDLGRVSKHEALYQGALAMVNHMHAWCEEASRPETTPMHAHERMEQLVTFWSGVFVGAPFIFEAQHA